MNKILIVLLIFLISIISVNAQTEYLTKGVTRDSTYNQPGDGLWAGRTPATYQRAGDYNSTVLVYDVDNDNKNEIIALKGTLLEIWNYTQGTGIILEASIDVGTQNYGQNNQYWQTPGLLDYDSDGYTEIILTNKTDFLTIQYNTTTITVEQTTTHNAGTRVGSMQQARYPVVKCAPGIQWTDGNPRCVTPYMHWDGANVQFAFMQIDLNANTANFTNTTAAIVTDNSRANTHLSDLNNDGYLDFTYRIYDAGNDDIDIWTGSIDATGGITHSLLYTHNLAGSALFTDVITNNLDGTLVNGLEITWGYTSDGTNWDACTISSSGSVIDCSYCTVLTCPEGELASLNMVEASDTTYCPYSGDVYYYVRNANNNDPGINTDTVHCISLFAGSGTQETTVSNVENFTSPFFIHQTDMYGSTGILTSLFGIQGGTKQSQPGIIGQPFIYPVDYQVTGSVDLIGADEDLLVYYDDAYTNLNIQVDSLDFDTANPVCFGELVGLTITISDDLNNPGYCHIQETWSNTTQKSIQSNTSVTTPGSYTLNYYADETGTYPLNVRCQDQYHTNYESRTYTVTVSNDTTVCNYKGQGAGSVSYNTSTSTAQNTDFLSNLDTALDDVGVRGSLFKGIIWVVMIMVVVGGMALYGAKEGLAGQAISILVLVILTSMLILGWYLNFIGGVPLVMYSLILAAVIGFKVFTNSANVTGGG